MNCYRCTTPIPDESMFCLRCGAQVSDPTGSGAAVAHLNEAATRELEQLLRDETLGEYEIEREAGRGGMGVVYLATEVHLGRHVAIKVLPPDLTYGKGAVERFKREAKTAAALDHPNIIPIYRITPGGRLFWYAMKYLEGRSLADILETRKQLPLDETITILEQVASALDYAHECRVIHRDVKPANVMIDSKERVVVTDFGIAKQLAAAGGNTASGAVIGTPYYMSGEQCRGQVLTGAADQYSVGVMAYHMLSGKVPFEGESVVDIVHKHCMEPPPPLEVLRPGLPREVYQAVERAMAKRPIERFSSVTAFVKALKGVSEAVTVPLNLKPAARRMRLGIAATAIGLAGLGGGAALLWSGRLSTKAAGGAPPPAVPQPSDSTRPPPTVSVQPQPIATRSAPTKSAPAPPAARRGAPGTLVIQTVGGWARIYIDGAFGREGTSHRDTSLTPGTHRLYLERPGYVTVDTTVTIRGNDTVLVRIAMRRAGA